MKSFIVDLGNVAIGVVVIAVILSVGAFVFSRLTKFNDQQEISKGNEAAGIYMGSKLLGLCIIVAMVSFSTDSWLMMLMWSAIGIVILCLLYVLVDLLLPQFRVCEEIAKGNMAVAQLLRSIIIGVSIVIGTMLI
ncbi:DUF350 domain-containing protein [Paenibacillus sp. ACRRX]|uniref:DUF350 domain-containing protein n=1 Tax=unclassified Paenibacillus TaxID=185978 RepID=UPI001EF6634A|nr:MULTISPECIES: DUF350 domain-containing protein [unclassified Paenibacillus]MCG7406250.1 DUF350 domain-containing protein [Paenibacillus sp. ACRRX]MDK8179283.1 DUF350 domain-containing protein [Paenibacillus sp. UMB4589-SE434]